MARQPGVFQAEDDDLSATSESLPDPLRGLDANTASQAVSLDNVTYKYPSGLTAIRDVSFTVPRRHRVAIVGPSGCGKSTILRLLAGTASPTAGTISGLSDHGPSGFSRAMVFQTDTLLPWLTVAENAALAFRLRGDRRSSYREWIHELLHMVGLDEFAQAYPYELSGGMRRRVAFLAAVAARPGILLLDEPFSSLDEPTRLGVHDDVLRITQLFDITLVLVTHDLAEAISLCNDVLIMGGRPGSIVARHEVDLGEAPDLYELRQTPEFLSLYGRLWHELSQQIQRSKTPSSRDQVSPS